MNQEGPNETERDLRRTRNAASHARAAKRKEQRKIDQERLAKDLFYEEKMERRAKEESRKDKALVKKHLRELSRLYECLSHARGGKKLVGSSLKDKIEGLDVDVRRAMKHLKEALWKIHFFENLDPGVVEYIGGYKERSKAYLERSRYWMVKMKDSNMPWNKK